VKRAHVERAVLDAAAGAGCEPLDLPAAAVHRFTRVLRLKDGDPVEIFDGSGRVARGVLAGSRLSDIVVRRTDDGLPPLIIAQAVVPTDKLELVVSKGTELGAAEIVLFDAVRGQVHLTRDRADKRVARLTRVAEDAARQSGRARVPLISGPIDGAGLLARVAAWAATGGLAAVGAIDASAPLSEALAQCKSLPAMGAFVVIGPEGGLDPKEIERLVAAGGVAVRLGAHVLRTETAGLAALAAIQACLGHL
jgi:16S rRNA (uracil1498-N3)-methyltransferase